MTESRPDASIDCASPPCFAHELDPLWSARAVPVRAPLRAVHGYVQRLCAPPARVLPMLCPVREAEWIPDWRPQFVISTSGVAEPDCVFATPSPTGSGSALWYVTRHDAASGYVEMVRIVPGHTACRLDIALAADGDSACLATITYRLTSLGPEGDASVAAYTEAAWLTFMQEWEQRLNHWLRTGRCLAQR